MKKYLVCAMLMCLALLCGCSDEPVADPTPSTETVLSSGSCFKVTENHSNGSTKYHYTITDKNGQTLESAICAKQPKVAVLNDSLIGIRFYVDDKSFCRYYDTDAGRVSGSFFNAFWDNGELVACHDYENGHRMMVRDIFNEDGYYYELDLDIHSLTITVTACEENSETGELTVEYSYSDNTLQGTAVLPTRAEPAEDAA